MNRVLYVLLLIVVYLFYGELRRAWEARQEALWDDRYVEAVRSSPEAWRLGWRLEDLEARLQMQRFQADGLKTVIAAEVPLGQLATQLWTYVEDDARYFTATCASRSDKMVQVGPDEFRDMGDGCRVFSGLRKELLGPQGLWQLVPLDGSDGSVGLRSLSNGKFLKVTAPPRDAAWDAPWLLETTSSLPGLAERFQLRQVDSGRDKRDDAPPSQKERDDDDWTQTIVDRRRRHLTQMPGDDDFSSREFVPIVPQEEELFASAQEEEEEVVKVAPDSIRSSHSQSVMLYSELMRGYVQCAGGGVTEPLRGFAGESLLEAEKQYAFNLTWVPNVKRARTLLEASQHVAKVRQQWDLAKKKPKRDLSNNKGYKIALVVPMTSRGTEMTTVDESPLWFNLFASFVESVDWRKNKHVFTFYLGFDRGDPLYDTGDAWSDLRRSFRTHAVRALKFLDYGNYTVHRVVQGGLDMRERGKKNRPNGGREKKKRQQKAEDFKRYPPSLNLKLFHFDDTLGAPSQAVSGLARIAVKKDKHDYVYQLNDDTILVSKDWADDMIDALRSSPLMPNLGVAGPLDTNNQRILTHAFVHKTHVEIFDAMFPSAFKNWWSDDWISTVYGSRATFARKEVIVTHNVQSQKTGAWNRYDVDHNAQHLLHEQVQRGFVTINTYLRHNDFDVLPLPNICGYSPMMTRIYDTLMRLTHN